MDKPRPFPFKYSLFSAVPDECSEAINDEHRETEAGQGTGQAGSKPVCSGPARKTPHTPAVPQDRLADFWRHDVAGFHRLFPHARAGPDVGRFGRTGHRLLLRGDRKSVV